MEVWRDIKGYEGFYQVSNFGNVKSLDRISVNKNGAERFFPGKMLKQKSDNYKRVQLQAEGKSEFHTVHRLVATAFIPNPENKPQVYRKDGDKANNHVDNLGWCTGSENVQHWYKELYGEDSLETRERKRQINLGKTYSVERRQNISKALKNYVKTQEHRDNLAKAGGTRVSVRGQEFISLKSASIYYGKNPNYFARALKEQKKDVIASWELKVL